MFKSILFSSVFILAFMSLSVVFFLKQCNVKNGIIKPTNIPEESVWVGGIDGGCWINVRDQVHDFVYNIDVFFESGQPWVSDTFRIQRKGACSEITMDRNQLIDSLNSFNGRVITFRYNNNFCDLIPDSYSN